MNRISEKLNLIIFLAGSLISGIGTKLATIALAGKVFQLTGKDFSISLVFLLQGIPMVLFGVVAGTFIDKCNKKIAFIVINIVLAATSFGLAFVSNMWVLYSVILINGFIQALFTPIRVTLMPLLIGEQDLIKANGFRVAMNGMVMIIGFALAGVLVSLIGTSYALMLDGLSFLIVAFVSILIKPRIELERTYSQENFNQRFWTEIRKGWNFIQSSPKIKYIFGLDVITNFIIMMQIPLTFVFVKSYFGSSILMAQRTGFLFSAAGVGTISGGIILGKFKNKNKLLLLSVSLIFDSVLVLLFSLNRSFPAALVIYGFMGILGAFIGSILETVIQESASKNLLGCVSGFVNSIVEPVCVLSLLFGGITTEFIEVKWIFIFCAFLELLTGTIFTIKYKTNGYKNSVGVAE
jgi:MFS transporter, DHA3 family, macrolide efflux protein